MQYIAYLRDQAALYRDQAITRRKNHEPDEATKYQDLAATCEEVAAEIEDHLPAG